MMTLTPSEKERYEARRKYELDRVSGLNYARMEGEKEGRKEGEINALRSVVARMVESRFPGLNPQELETVKQVEDVEKLQEYLLKLSASPVFVPYS
jgi:hypothetical protein